MGRLSGRNVIVNLNSNRLAKCNSVEFTPDLTDKAAHSGGKLSGYLKGIFSGEGKINMDSDELKKITDDMIAKGLSWQDYPPIPINYNIFSNSTDTLNKGTVEIPEAKLKPPTFSADLNSEEKITHDIDFFCTANAKVNGVWMESDNNNTTPAA